MMERMMTLFFLACSGVYLHEALRFSFGCLEAPKAGFMPTIIGVFGVTASLVLLIRQFRAGTKRHIEINRTKLAFIFLGFFLFLLLFRTVGYWPATFGLLLYLFKIGGVKGWQFPIWIAVGGATFFFTLFKYYLGVLLP